jgi:hypothetical protein
VLPLHHSPRTAGKDSYLTTKDHVARLLAEGQSVTAIARQLGVSKATVCFHKRTLGYEMDGRFGRRYDWAEIQRHYDAGHSARACREAFGCSAWSWSQAVRRGVLALRPKSRPIEMFLVQGKRTDRGHLKRRLLDAGLKAPRCEGCGIEEWLGKPLSLELHHVNGDGLDNRLENLQLLCPNCHCLTDTWGGRNARRRAA